MKISGLTHVEQVRLLIEGGATLIQLREKSASRRSFLSEAREALRQSESAGVKLIINDRVDIALTVNAAGVHLGQTDMPVKAARRLLGDNAIIGMSTHNITQVKHALHLPIDYLAFGPIYPTKSKSNPDPILGLEQLAEVKSLAGAVPLVAIGGIDQSNVLTVLAAGADSVAVISAVLVPASRIAKNLKVLVDKAQKKY